MEAPRTAKCPRIKVRVDDPRGVGGRAARVANTVRAVLPLCV